MDSVIYEKSSKLNLTQGLENLKVDTLARERRIPKLKSRFMQEFFCFEYYNESKDLALLLEKREFRG